LLQPVVKMRITIASTITALVAAAALVMMVMTTTTQSFIVVVAFSPLVWRVRHPSELVASASVPVKQQ
jgi:hypothetical protein